jgi:lysyl-tRNA synthetase class 2
MTSNHGAHRLSMSPSKEHRRPVSSIAPAPWWRAEIHGARRPFLLSRNAITRAVREWFDTRGFVEVETAALQVSPGNEAHLHAFATEMIDLSGSRTQLYLHTSPEFACKKLLAAGERMIFDFARVWRNRERGPLHHPEFTMLEWYRADAPYSSLMEDCAALLALAASTTRCSAFVYRGRTMDPFAEPERLTVAEAFDRFAGLDLLSTVATDGSTDRDALAAGARAGGVKVADDDTWTDVFSRVMVERIEHRLGVGRPTILHEYPASEAALARLSPREPRVAERFELYACGVELANAFAELTDPVEQRRRFETEMNEKMRVYGERYALDEEFLDALGHMPQACGAALGFDRLAMLASGATRIEQVLWTPVVTAG